MAMAGMATTARGRQPQLQDIIIDIVDMAATVEDTDTGWILTVSGYYHVLFYKMEFILMNLRSLLGII